MRNGPDPFLGESTLLKRKGTYSDSYYQEGEKN